MLVLRMLSRPRYSITTRSSPTPTPPCGGTPYLKLSMYDRTERIGMPHALARSVKATKAAKESPPVKWNGRGGGRTMTHVSRQRTFEQIRAVNTLGAADDLFATYEHVERVGVPRVVCVGHGVKRSHAQRVPVKRKRTTIGVCYSSVSVCRYNPFV